MNTQRLALMAVGTLLLLSGCSSNIPGGPSGPPLMREAITDHVLETRISAGTDDVEENNTNGGVTRFSTRLDLIRSNVDQTVGLRFTGLSIPAGAMITNAYIQFKARVTDDEVTSLTLQGQAGDNPPSFSGAPYNVSNRARTTASVAWAPAAWTSGQADAAQRTPNLAAIVQELVDRPNWTSGNALALVITGSGQRVAYSYDASPADAPLLHIEYSVDDTPPPPVPTVEARISTGSNDAEENSTNGGVTRFSTRLDLTRSVAEQTVGLRFANLGIHRNVAITDAYVQFKAVKSTTEATELTLEAQAGDNPPGFSGSLYNVSARARTTASVTWAPAAWKSGEADAAQRTPNLAPIVQEIVNRPGWRSGNALVLIITGTGQRVAWSYDGNTADAPLLHIEYSATDTPPSVRRFDADPGTVVRGQSVSFSWSVSDPDGDLLQCSLDADGDGVDDHAISDCRNTTTQTHTYSTAGRFWPTLTVTDSKNAVDTKNFSLQVTNGSSVTVAAAGDIACDPGYRYYNDGAGTSTRCRMKATADLLAAIAPEAVLTTGDNQYDDGTLEKFMQSYDPTWGQFKDITYPVAGTHEYQSGNADGYFAYFGPAAGSPSKGYYSLDLGAWHVVVLNTSCSRVGGCGSGSPQERWLRADLAANTKLCTLAAMKLPLFSSGARRSNNGQSKPLWQALYEADAEIVLSGSDHLYERFAPQTPDGVLDPEGGTRQFVVGTGGKTLHSFSTVQPNSEARIGGTFGVLELALHPTSYDWTFRPEAGKTSSDTGTGMCH